MGWVHLLAGHLALKQCFEKADPAGLSRLASKSWFKQSFCFNLLGISDIP